MEGIRETRIVATVDHLPLVFETVGAINKRDWRVEELRTNAPGVTRGRKVTVTFECDRSETERRKDGQVGWKNDKSAKVHTSLQSFSRLVVIFSIVILIILSI